MATAGMPANAHTTSMRHIHQKCSQTGKCSSAGDAPQRLRRHRRRCLQQRWRRRHCRSQLHSQRQMRRRPQWKLRMPRMLQRQMLQGASQRLRGAVVRYKLL